MVALLGGVGVLVVIVLVIGVVLIGILVGMYNSLVGKKNQVQNVFASVDALLKKRYDLIPNLVAAVQTYMKHEAGTLTKVTELRAQAMAGNLTPDQRVALDNQMSKLLGGIMVAVENYPDLKANQNFLQLQGSLTEIEEQISAGRRAYNATVNDYNNAVEMFPTNLMAGMMGYQRKTYFEAAETERQNVDVKKMFQS